MRHKIFIISILSVAFMFTGCEDFLTDEPESVLTSIDFYTTPERIEVGVIGCYAGMKRIVNDEWQLTEIRSDNTCVAQVNSGSDTRVRLANYAHFTILPSEQSILDYWFNTFQNIATVNTILPSVQDDSYIKIEEDRAAYDAELRFIRAYHYFNLVNLFGDMFEITDLIGPNDALSIPRSPVADVYNNIIIPDLMIAAENAPSIADAGRITKWAAKGMLAKAYMQMGGTENLALAKSILGEFVIDKSSPHGLLDTVPDIFDISNEMNEEIIFAIRYAGVTGNGSPFFEYFAPSGTTDVFPIGSGGGDGDNNPSFELIRKFEQDPDDSRNQFIDIFSRSYDAPYLLKYVDYGMTNYSSAENDWIVLRYADIILLYAEILAQDGNHADAHIYVNEIRARAGKTLVADPFTSKEEALDFVYLERRLELAFENQRWFDLLRMNQSYNDPNKAMDILKSHTFGVDWFFLYGLYSKIPLPVEANYNNDRLLLPIPQDEIDGSELDIQQNPGY
ncbi:RagB/SusD family nutrient uptake outer membrane protein [Bacteroidota bacterium]